MLYNSKQRSLVLFGILVITNICVYPEFLLYKKGSRNPDGIDPIGYSSLSGAQKKEVIHLYHQTIRKYTPPFAFNYVEALKKDREYMAALQTDYGLLTFLQKKADQLSHGTYGIVWMPTTVYEVIALKYFDHKKRMNIVNGLKWYINQGTDDIRDDITKVISIPDLLKTEPYDLEEARQDWNTLQVIYFSINDRALELYRNADNTFIKQHTKTSILPDTTKILEQESKNLNHTTISYYKNSKGHRYSKEYNALLQPRDLPILHAFISFELTALRNNHFLLVRGTKGFMHNATTYLDYNFGKDNTISYAYSLCAGTYFDREDHLEPTDDIKKYAFRGARALDYIRSYDMGYVLSIPLQMYIDFDEQYSTYFFLPALSTLEGLLSKGEYFHPRFRILDEVFYSPDRFQAQQFFGTLMSLAQLLWFPKAIKLSPDTFKKRLLQQYSFIFAESQKRFSIMKEEEQSLYDIYKEHLIVLQEEQLQPLPQDIDFVANHATMLSADDTELLLYFIEYFTIPHFSKIYNQFDGLSNNTQEFLVSNYPLSSLPKGFSRSLSTKAIKAYQHLESEMLYDILKSEYAAGKIPSKEALDLIVYDDALEYNDDDLIIYCIPHFNDKQLKELYQHFSMFSDRVQLYLAKEKPIAHISGDVMSSLSKEDIHAYHKALEKLKMIKK